MQVRLADGEDPTETSRHGIHTVHTHTHTHTHTQTHTQRTYLGLVKSNAMISSWARTTRTSPLLEAGAVMVRKSTILEVKSRAMALAPWCMDTVWWSWSSTLGTPPLNITMGSDSESNHVNLVIGRQLSPISKGGTSNNGHKAGHSHPTPPH